MADYKVYEIKQSIFKANDDAADVLLSLIHISEPTRH